MDGAANSVRVCARACVLSGCVCMYLALVAQGVFPAYQTLHQASEVLSLSC